MKKVNLKQTVWTNLYVRPMVMIAAIAIGLVTVSCGGGNTNKQNGTATETATKEKTEQAASSGGKMATFDFGGTDVSSYKSSVADFEKLTGLAGIGKPVGYKMKASVHGDGIIGIDFSTEGEITQQDIDDYARAVWDLCRKVSKNPPYNYNDEPLKSFDDARKKQSEPYFHYLWYYNTSEYRFRTAIYAEKDKSEDAMRLRLFLEYRPLKK